MFLNQQGRINPKVAVSVVYVSAMFMSIMDTSIVNVALPSIGRDFRVAPTAAYRITFLVAAAIALVGVAAALSIKDIDAARTMVNPRLRAASPPVAPAAEPAT